MSRYHIALTTAAAAAAVAVSACSGTAPAEPKPWPSVGTGGVVAAPTSATVKPAYAWQDVSGQGVEAPRDSNPRTLAQYGSVPVPGIQVQHAENGEMFMCTVGPAVVPEMSPANRGFLTAAHCSTSAGGPLQWLQPAADGDPTPLAPATGSGDAVAVWTSTVPEAATTIAGTWPVAGVLTPEGVQKLVPTGSFVCINGAITGVKCGLREADQNGKMIVRLHAEEGDSGSPVFVVDSQNRAVLIGLLQGGNTPTIGASYLEPILTAARAKVQLAADATPLDGDGFSLRTVA